MSATHSCGRSRTTQLAPADRRRVHAVLAGGRRRRDQAERATWHRAAAADGPDETVATELEALAHEGERRGALSTKARCFARAASLSARVDDRARRLLESADAWLAAGQWRAALDQLDAARAVASDPGLLADIAASTGQLEAYRAGPDRGIAHPRGRCRRHRAHRPGPGDPSAHLRGQRVGVRCRRPRATALADRAVACGNAAGGLSVVSGLMARVEAGLLTGDPDVRGTARPTRHAGRQPHRQRPPRRRARLLAGRPRRLRPRVLGSRRAPRRRADRARRVDRTGVPLRLRRPAAGRAAVPAGAVGGGLRHR